MTPANLPPSPLRGTRAIELGADDAPLLQRFFDANPGYFATVQGEPAWPDAARRELHEAVPAHMPSSRKWIVGWRDDGGDLAAVASVVSDLISPGVWHLGLFVVDSRRHGSGDAQALYGSIEDWARAGGAEWLRLGVVEGNDRAERFWTRQGYLQTRTRDGVPMGRTTKTVRVKVKPLAGGAVQTYLGLVPRDRPDSLEP
jgi:GNAT superfamily N-acetyltransferase